MSRQVKQAISTYKQIRVDLIGLMHNRDSSGSKDQRFINCYPETTKSPTAKEPKKYLVKRAGLSLDTTIVYGNATGRGIYYYEGNTYSVFGDKLYKGDTGNPPSSLQTLSTSTGSVGWAESSGVTKYLFLCDGTDGYVITPAGVVTKINVTYTAWAASTNYSLDDIRIPTVDNGFYYKVTADAGSSGGTQPTWPTTIGNTVVDGGITWTCSGSYGGFPTPHVPKPVFLDGYIFLIDSGTSDIYNCDLENPLGWSAANFISAEMWPDDSTGLARQNNQVVVFGRESVEFFYDDGSTGTPLARNDSAALEIGLAAQDSIFQDERIFIFVGQSGTGGRAVWAVQGFQPKKVSYEGIERILDAEGTSITSAKGFGVRTNGHFFYVLNLTSKTLVFDLEEGMWHEWSTDSSGSHTKFAYSYASDKLTGVPLLQHDTNGNIYAMKPSVYQDDGSDIGVEFVTSNLDFGSFNRKSMSTMNVILDSTTFSATLQFRWSDDDYKNWSSWKSLDISQRPYFMKLGTFRRRAFNFKFYANAPLRIDSIEFDFNSGVN